MTITYECDRDCGCEISDADFDSYLEAVAVRLSAAFPGAAVKVLESGGRSRGLVDGDSGHPLVDDIEQIAQMVWSDGEFYA